MSLSFVVIGEARADFTTATELADRVLLEQVNWLEESTLGHQRNWVGETPAGDLLTWTSVAHLARSKNIRVHGHFAGEPGLPDAQAARRAMAFVRHQFASVDSILLIRDADDQLIRRKGLEQARNTDAIKSTIVIGLAICERESWVVSGFEAKSDEEHKIFAAETRSLGWNPSLRSHELTAGKDDTALKSPKRVLKTLAREDWNRERECWTKTLLKTLRERGVNNGLADYLAEIAHRLVPLITGYAPIQ